MSTIEKIDAPKRPYVGIRRSVHHKELPAYFGEVFPKVMTWVAKNGITPASPPMAVWHGMDQKTGICDVQAGCFLLTEHQGEDEITGGTTAGGESLRLVHVGAYHGMGQSWSSVFNKAKELGRPPKDQYEVYIDDPGQVKPEDLRTEITLGLGK